MTATLTTEQIRRNATEFYDDFKDETYEMGEAQNFMRGFCKVFGISGRRLIRFEERVKKVSGTRGRIDGLLPQKLLIEMKSAGEDLDEAYKQAVSYYAGIAEDELPRFVLVSDFANLHLYDRDSDFQWKMTLEEFPHKLTPFLFLADYEVFAATCQQDADIKAAEHMALIHDAFKAAGCEGRDLETYLVRILFCLFADDTDIFPRENMFLEYLVNHTGDGNLHGQLDRLFTALNTPEDSPKRKTYKDDLKDFPYINGSLFSDRLDSYELGYGVREILIQSAKEDWSGISPAIFGSLFQAIMHHDDEAGKAKTKKRREFGAHYTSEENILKVIKPLFLNDLRSEFDRIKKDPKKLEVFHLRLEKLNFLDPACGCGNFLVVAYRELRILELDVIEAWNNSRGKKGDNKTLQMDVDTIIRCNVDQFHGIEIDGSAAKIATVAMWLTDHQMNQQVKRIGKYYKRIPLIKKANIVHGNALTIQWSTVIDARNLNYIMGNPPFIGAKFMSDEQRSNVEGVFGDIKSAGLLDFVAAWYVQAARFMKGTKIRCGFVSTNSITQGEQVGVLWSWMLAHGMKVFFAHRTFSWSNEARGNAAVHCVIVGFAAEDISPKWLYEYEHIKGEPQLIQAKNINPYLIDGLDVIAYGRMQPICHVPVIVNGSIPADGGNLILSPEEKAELIAKEPTAEKWIRPYLGAEGFIHNDIRYCLWLAECPPHELKQMSLVLERVKAVRLMRQASTKSATQEKANIPTLFTENRQPKSGSYLAIPRTSSENRKYLPIGYLSSDYIAANDLQIIPNANLYSFGILASLMHRSWVSTTAGRLKSDLRYSVKFTYNTFPWPENPDDKQIKTIEIAAQAVLDARAQFPDSSLADLYDPNSMPPALTRAHQALDKAVDAAYGKTNFKTEAERVAFLFQKYAALANPLLGAAESTEAPVKRIKKAVSKRAKKTERH